MDFVRLAMREVKRNSSRTAIGIAATALATVVMVLSRIVPQGYMRYQSYAERVFAGADIVVWPAPAHVRVGDRSVLEWREWAGEEWQSFAEYFIPSLPTEGYVCPIGAPPWQPLDVEMLSKSLTAVEGVDAVAPYLSFPCRVEVGDVFVDAILRGREPDPEPNLDTGEYPFSMAGQIKTGRPLVPDDDGTLNALVPIVSDPPVPYAPNGELRISLPRMAEEQGAPRFDWEDPISLVLTEVGGYVVKIGEIPGSPQSDGTSAKSIPVYWERPEIIVSGDTFAELVGQTLLAVDATESGYPAPVYQLLVRISRSSETKALVERIRANLGPDYTVFSIAELATIRDHGGGQQILTRDMSPILMAMLLVMAAAIVTGSVYVLLALQTRKIGLMRAIGATSKDILIYVLSIIVYTTLIGAGFGFLVGKLITLTVLLATDFTFLEWLRMAALDALLALSGLAVSLTLGLCVALWASRIPCAEVLRRE